MASASCSASIACRGSGPRVAGPPSSSRATTWSAIRIRHFVRVAPSCPRRRDRPRPHPGRREPAPRRVVRDGGDERDRDVRTGTEHGSEPGTARPVVDPLHVDDGRRRVRTQPLRRADGLPVEEDVADDDEVRRAHDVLRTGGAPRAWTAPRGRCPWPRRARG